MTLDTRCSKETEIMWKPVSDKLLETLNGRVAYQQCMYKYNALKKKWREVIDFPSGSETKHFTHKDEFDIFMEQKIVQNHSIQLI